MCDHIVKLRGEKTTFHVSGKLFKADVNLQFEVQEQEVVNFSLYNFTPHLRVWGTTFYLRNNRLNSTYHERLVRSYHGRQIIYNRTWQCIDTEYFNAMNKLIYMCVNSYDANEIMQSIGVNFGVFVTCKTICDFMLFTQKNNISLV